MNSLPTGNQLHPAPEVKWSPCERYVEIGNNGNFLIGSHDPDFNHFLIADIWVKPSMRENGIGKELVRMAQTEALRLGISKIVASIISRESLDVMISVFGENAVNIEQLGNYIKPREGDISVADDRTVAFLDYHIS